MNTPKEANVLPTSSRCTVRGALMTLAIFCSTLIAATPASHAKVCKDFKVAAAGSPYTSRSIQALPSALIAWKQEVRQELGSEWNFWVRAEDKATSCRQISAGENKGKWVCQRSGRPCTGPIGKEVDAVCKNEKIVVAGQQRISKRAAVREAKEGWFNKAVKEHGATYAVWENAADQDVTCVVVDDRYRCEAVAQPCVR